MNDVIIAYTDGSVIGNGSKNSRCGWAIKLMYKGKYITKSGKCRGWTNNQVEMYAMLQALTSIKDKTIPTVIYSDSQYVVKSMNGEFNIHTNEEMWAKIQAEAANFNDLKIEWVRGHAGNKHNTEVDALANQEADNA